MVSNGAFYDDPGAEHYYARNNPERTERNAIRQLRSLSHAQAHGLTPAPSYFRVRVAYCRVTVTRTTCCAPDGSEIGPCSLPRALAVRAALAVWSAAITTMSYCFPALRSSPK